MRDVLPQVMALPFWPKISGAVFFLLFLGIIWFVFRKDRKQEYEACAKLPLEDL